METLDIVAYTADVLFRVLSLSDIIKLFSHHTILNN